MRLLLACTLVLLPAVAWAATPDYVRDVKPIFARHCVSCHGPQKQRSGLRLDTARAALRGGNSGKVVLPGRSTASLLVQAVSGAEGVKAMPPKGPRLEQEKVAILRAWIDDGAKAPTAEVETPAASTHWAFQRLVRPTLPVVGNGAWCRNGIDRFVLARLDKEGIAPSPEADRATLLRRMSLDLTGLPPTPAEIDAFVHDSDPEAYEKVVDRLLGSAHYGERWGRHWLDLARYADSNGYSIDAPRSIFKYRDWVIDALNRDLPFDQFVVEQLAGDMLPGATVAQRVATGFHRNTQINQEGGIDEEQFRVEAIIDRLNTTGTALLGLTVGCAQCHDHKFDPLSQREYYQLFAFFNSCDEPTLEMPAPDAAKRRKMVQAKIEAVEKELSVVDDATEERVAAWEGSLTPKSRAMLPANVQAILAIAVNGRSVEQQQAIIGAYRKTVEVRHVLGGLAAPTPFLAAAHVNALGFRQARERRLAALYRERPELTTTMVLSERKEPRTTHVHLGGDFLRKGAVVSPGVPAVLPKLDASKPTRLDLARWFVSGSNPLPPRVTMNRCWMHCFGTGIVETDNDFGTQGTPPSHPELLDWLAAEFVDRGWSMKAMLRLIVTSATYRQASHVRPDLAVADPRNRLLARQNRIRLDAEVVRDVALAASGLLTRTIGGPSVYPPQPLGVYQFTQIPRQWTASSGPDRYRRGVYTFVWRSAPHPDLVVFDAPDGTQSCTRRNRSNTPLQALALLNDEGFLEYARALACRTLAEGPVDDGGRLGYAVRLCLGRTPSNRETAVLMRLLDCEREAFEKDPDAAIALIHSSLPCAVGTSQRAAWIAVARALLNLDEFITRE
jgi:mono/diheme cytochrome c family protein